MRGGSCHPISSEGVGSARQGLGRVIRRSKTQRIRRPRTGIPPAAVAGPSARKRAVKVASGNRGRSQSHAAQGAACRTRISQVPGGKTTSRRPARHEASASL